MTYYGKVVSVELQCIDGANKSYITLVSKYADA